MNNSVNYFILFLCLALISPVFGQQDFNALQPEIKFNQNGNMLIINSMVSNRSTKILPVRYQMIVKKKSKSNNISQNVHSGNKTIKSEGFESLSKVMINFLPGDQVNVELKIFDGNKEVLELKEALTNNNEESVQQKNKQQIYIDGVTTIGVVIDETFSKLGKDFFDLFFSEYNLDFKQSPYNITIEESPHLGRTTKITVTFEGNVLTEFNSNPNQEFLENYATYVVSLIKREIQRRNELGINTKSQN